MAAPISYRPDIDGLRALAVLGVILFHFNVPRLTGGFTGVDIFFVISGYLIIGIIHREIKSGTFSLVDFWERRIRRIIPAMVVVLVVTAVASYHLLLLPQNYVDFGYSLMAQSAFVSNWWFMQSSGYFAAPTDTMPLLHTWTLAVEEQFYVLFPLCTVLVYPYIKKYFRQALLGVALLSFFYGAVLLYREPTAYFSIPLVPHIFGSADNGTAAFYFVFPRLWEFLVGGLIALYALTIRGRILAEVTAFLGAVSIMAGMIVLTKDSLFPGYSALLPVFGTAAIIVANTKHKTLVYDLLSFRAVVFIGLISYSLYLWHWPVLVLGQYLDYQSTGLSLKNGLLLALLIFSFSVLTYRFVETPVRKRQVLKSQKSVYAAALMSLLTTFGIGYAIIEYKGFPERVPEGARLYAAAMEDSNPRRDECFTHESINTQDNRPCLLGLEDPEHIDFVLWGDSHAEAAMPAFEAYGRITKQTGIFFGAPGCPPLITNAPLAEKEPCREETERALSYMREHTPKEIFIVSEWRKWYETEDSEVKLDPEPLIKETLASLPRESQITISQRVTTFPAVNYRKYFVGLARTNKDIQYTMPRQYFTYGLDAFYADLEGAAAPFENVRILDPLDSFCSIDTCRLGNKNGLYYRDSSHLTNHGARQIILPLLLKEAETSSPEEN